MGTLRMEVGDSAHIVCKKTGLRADIDFHQKPFIGYADRLNSLSAVIRRMGHAGSTAHGEELFHISGHWDSEMHITAAAKGAAKELFLDVRKETVSPKYVLPLEQQGPWESRRLWAHCTAELVARPIVNWAAVDKEKAQLEEEQRLLPCHTHKEKSPEFVPWVTKKFHKKAVADPIKGKSPVTPYRWRRVCAGARDVTPRTHFHT